VKNMKRMFWYATSFNQPINFNTEKVTNMEDMFDGATAMTHPHPTSPDQSQRKPSVDLEVQVHAAQTKCCTILRF